MGMSSTSLMTSMLVSTIGFGFFIYGKKQQRLPQILTGVALMVYPYFVDSAAWMLAVGAGAITAMYVAIRYGA